MAGKLLAFFYLSDLLLIFGACFRKAWPLGPWLVITLVEHLVVGVPLIVFTGIISLYLASQLQLVITGSILIGVILVVFSLSMSSWFTVLQVSVCVTTVAACKMKPFIFLQEAMENFVFPDEIKTKVMKMNKLMNIFHAP